MFSLEELMQEILYRLLVGYVVILAPMILFVSLTLPIDCSLWEVLALSAAFACAASLVYSLASLAGEAAVQCAVALLEQAEPLDCAV
jgi:predicted ABC-type sugar transport system permease subunit